MILLQSTANNTMPRNGWRKKLMMVMVMVLGPDRGVGLRKTRVFTFFNTLPPSLPQCPPFAMDSFDGMFAQSFQPALFVVSWPGVRHSEAVLCVSFMIMTFNFDTSVRCVYNTIRSEHPAGSSSCRLYFAISFDVVWLRVRGARD